MTDLEHARGAKRALADRLAADPRVVGVGLSREADRYVVQVRLAEAVEDGVLPAAVSDVPVRWQVVGPIHPR